MAGLDLIHPPTVARIGLEHSALRFHLAVQVQQNLCVGFERLPDQPSPFSQNCDDAFPVVFDPEKARKLWFVMIACFNPSHERMLKAGGRKT